MVVDMGREICGNLVVAESREWLCTDSSGDFSSGTVARLLGTRPRDGSWAICHGALQRIQGPEAAQSYPAPMAHHLTDYDVGSIAEIFDGDPPFAPRGCVAQIWSVAETLRAWRELAASPASGPRVAVSHHAR